MHPLLQRQIELCTSASGQVDLKRLRDLVNETYQQEASARKRLERAMHLMSEEMQELNDQLAEEAMLAMSRFVLESREAMISLWPDDTIGIMNKVAGALLGVENTRVVSGTPVQSVLDPKELVEGRVVSLEIASPDGRSIPVTANLSRGIVNGIEIRLVALRDEREQRMREEALDQARVAAESANQQKSSFLAMMSHELRTPLNAMLGSADLLSRTALDPRQTELLAMFREAGGLMLALVNDVLDFAKIEAGQLELNPHPVSLVSLAGDITGMWAGEAERKGLSLTVDTGATEQVVVRADLMRLRQILFNLVSNALKFTTKGGVSVRFAATRQGFGLCVTFEVSDTGIGISEARMWGIFDPFIQADSSITRQYGGTGLGLPISRSLARQMGGDITVTSQVSQGSTFKVALQLDECDQLDEQIEPEQDLVLDRPVRVLAAEDNELNRRILSAILELVDASVTWAFNGVEAVTQAACGAFDVILMDIQMPVMDGMTAARAIRAAGGPSATTPIIALTANVSTADQARYRDAGLDGFVPKPIEPGVLLKAIGACIGQEAGETVEPQVVASAG